MLLLLVVVVVGCRGRRRDGEHGAFAERVQVLQGGRGALRGVAFVRLDLVGEAQFFEEPEDALGPGAFEALSPPGGPGLGVGEGCGERNCRELTSGG